MNQIINKTIAFYHCRILVPEAIDINTLTSSSPNPYSTNARNTDIHFIFVFFYAKPCAPITTFSSNIIFSTIAIYFLRFLLLFIIIVSVLAKYNLEFWVTTTWIFLCRWYKSLTNGALYYGKSLLYITKKLYNIILFPFLRTYKHNAVAFGPQYLLHFSQ